MPGLSFPDRETVLDFISKNPSLTTKQEIARGLKVKGRERQMLRAILKELESEGVLVFPTNALASRAAGYIASGGKTPAVKRNKGENI